MSRPLRIEFSGAIYHVTARGDRREPIFEDDADREALLSVIAQAMNRFDAQMLAYCLMGNHYHFVLHTRQANLSLLMRHINGVYTQTFNRRHGKVGHLFQGRFKAILVDREAYLLEVCRYVELNPVRAKLVAEPGEWPWSSFRAHVNSAPTPLWLDTAGLQAYVLGREAHTPAQRERAAARYAALVAAGRDVALWDEALRQQIFLGDDDFIARMQALAEPSRMQSVDVPRAHRTEQRRIKRSLDQWLRECLTRDEAMWSAYTRSGLRMTEIARAAGLSISRVSRLIAAEEARQRAAEHHAS
jgi:putative transposase